MGALAILANPLAWGQGAVQAWGRYYEGNGYVPMYAPAGLGNVVTVASGADHALALRADGTVAAWGACWFPWGFQAPIVPAGLSNVVAIAAGENQSLALRADGTLVAWDSYGVQAIPADATNVVAIAAGGYGTAHNLAVRADGRVIAWGYNFSGQATVPVDLTNAVAVAAGGFHSLALRADGTVAAWGSHDHGQTTVPAGMTDGAEVAAGKVFLSLAVKSDGTVVSWGECYNGSGYVPLDVPAGLTKVVSVSAGNYHAVALQADGDVVVWGLYHDGVSYEPMPAPPGLTNVVAVSSGGNHALAVSGSVAPFLSSPLLDQTALAGTTAAFRMQIAGTRPFQAHWRFDGVDLPGETNRSLLLTNLSLNQAGRYSVAVSNGVGTVESRDATLTVVPLAITSQPQNQTGLIGGPVSFNVACVSAAPLSYQWQFKGIDLPGETNAFLNLAGLTGDQAGYYSVVISNRFGTVVSSNAVLGTVPLAFLSQPGSQAVVRGTTASLAADCLSYLPTTYQWRLNGVEIAGGTNNPLVLTNVDWIHGGNYSVWASNSAGVRSSSNALLRISTLATTISAWGFTNALTIVPAGFTNAAALAAGQNHTLVLWADGTIAAWGADDYGQATPPPAATNVLAIAAGGDHSLALRSDGTVVGWGKNDHGQATAPAGLSNVIALAAGAAHSLALRFDGTVTSWGFNGQGQTNVPADLSNVVAVAAGTNHSLALRADGRVVAWGANQYGQTNVPAGLTNAVALAAGAGHSLALTAGGTVTAWGSYYAGRTWLPMTVPAGLTNALAVASGLFHNLALRSDGTVIAWGWNGNGQTNVPAGMSNGIAIAAGGARSLALLGNHGPRRGFLLTQPARRDSSFSLEVPTTCGRVYSLEYSDALAETNWLALPLVPGIGAPRTLADDAPVADQRFYRVREW